MPRPYFERTPLDAAYYAEHLRPRLPARIFDVHAHLNLPEHIGGGCVRLRPGARRT
jgi:hypothetical protein